MEEQPRVIARAHLPMTYDLSVDITGTMSNAHANSLIIHDSVSSRLDLNGIPNEIFHSPPSIFRNRVSETRIPFELFSQFDLKRKVSYLPNYSR